VTFKSTREYFEKGQTMRAENAAFAARLHDVASMHKRGLEALIDWALAERPVPADDAAD
jgi:hypothetical protein